MTTMEQKLRDALGELTLANIQKLQQLEEMAARITQLEAEVGALTPENPAD